jgi:hypothetical protein
VIRVDKGIKLGAIPLEVLMPLIQEFDEVT